MSDSKTQAEPLVRSMRERAATERAEIERTVESQIEVILSAARREAQARKDAALALVEREVTTIIESRRAIARLQSGAERAQAKQKLVADVFGQVESKIQSMAGVAYEGSLRKLLSEAISVLSQGTVFVRTEDEGVARAMLEGSKFTVTGIEAERGTVIVEAPGGGRRVDNSVSVRHRRGKSVLSAEVGVLLFGAHSQAGKS
ncbi:MAG TPA: V-type ATP synthase subunit E [Spirochaetia bacterium]|nr:V-type ATP synthase subunit E [Spirochaetia bacterium]